MNLKLIIITHTLVLHNHLNRYHGMYSYNQYNNLGCMNHNNRQCKNLDIHYSTNYRNQLRLRL